MNELYLHSVRILNKCVPDRADRPWLDPRLDALALQSRHCFVYIGHEVGDVVDGAVEAWGRRFVSTSSREKPDAAVAEALDSSFELGALPTAEHALVPIQRSRGIGHAQVHVVEAEQLSVLNHLDLRSPEILDEAEFEEPGDVTRRREHLGTG